ncbi:MAG: serine/threonine-protein kinase [Minicystis sp.]
MSRHNDPLRWIVFFAGKINQRAARGRAGDSASCALGVEGCGEQSGVTDTYEEPRIFEPGDPFRQHYLVEAFLGAGASGQVYAVRHRFTGDRFGLKVGHLKDRRNAKRVARSLIEAQATYAIRHPNVVRVVDLACEDDGMVWQLMELLEGRSLGAMLGEGGRLSPRYALDIAVEIAWGLQAAHEQQIIHRDIHPFNVFITTSGQVKVLDFSLAKVIPSGLQTTRGNHTMGTRGYMAPEYLKGGLVTPQLDVYALGILLWQMLAGRNPFVPPGADLMTVVRKQLEEEPPSLVSAAGLPAYFDEVLRRATARDPAGRHEGMWALGQALLWLRERLFADPEAAVLRRYTESERQQPIVHDTEGHAQYAALRSLPGTVTAPPMPSARLVVMPALLVGREIEGETPAKKGLAKTAPMVAVGDVGGGGVRMTPVPEGVERRSAPTPERRSAPTLIDRAPVVPVGVVAREVDVGAPTVRRARAPRRGLWALVVVPVVVVIGVVVWLLVGAAGGRAVSSTTGAPTLKPAGTAANAAPSAVARPER